MSLFYAAEAGNVKTTGLLLKQRDINANVMDQNNLTPLWYAASRGHYSVVKGFLECPIINFRPENECHSPLIAAIVQGHQAIFEILLESKKIDHHATDPDGWPALSYAVRRGNSAVVWLLLKYDAYPGILHADGTTPLNMAVAQGHEDIVKMLLNSIQQHRELRLAASTGRANMVQLLLDNGADMNEEDKEGQTPLVRANASGHVDVVKVLLNHRVS